MVILCVCLRMVSFRVEGRTIITSTGVGVGVGMGRWGWGGGDGEVGMGRWGWGGGDGGMGGFFQLTRLISTPSGLQEFF